MNRAFFFMAVPLVQEFLHTRARCPPSSNASGIRWKNALPMSDPEANPMRAVKMRFRKASFRPMKRIPMNDIRLTMDTAVRITTKSAIDFKPLNVDVFGTFR